MAKAWQATYEAVLCDLDRFICPQALGWEDNTIIGIQCNHTAGEVLIKDMGFVCITCGKANMNAQKGKCWNCGLMNYKRREGISLLKRLTTRKGIGRMKLTMLMPPPPSPIKPAGEPDGEARREPDYKRMYFRLAGKMANIIEFMGMASYDLKQVQQEAEEMYISCGDEAEKQEAKEQEAEKQE